jgi:hypothetical protein
MKSYHSRAPRRAGLFAAAAFLGLSATQAYAIDVAGNLLVDLDAATFSSGGTLWNNGGTLGGAFNASPTVVGGFQKQTFNGAAGLVFNDQNYYLTGPLSDASIEGNQDRSIEMWVWDNGALIGEESLLSWGHRGGPDGSNQSFNLGVDGRWGAVGHWGNPDLGWDPRFNGNGAGTKPVRGTWHHLVYTYDGAGHTAVYADGILKNSEDINGFGGLNTYAGNRIVIGAQTADGANNIAVDPNLAFTGAISRVRVHSGALTPAQVANNYNLERSTFSSGTTAPLQLSGVPVHRYTMNGLTSAANGTLVVDSGSKAGPVTNAFIRGAGANFTAAGIDLPGGDSHTNAYIDLPNGIMSGNLDSAPNSSVTLETWVTIQSTQNWSRYMDFGTTAIGEVPGAGGDFNGEQYITVSANIGTDPSSRMEHLRSLAVVDNRVNIDLPNTLNLNQEVHVVMVYDATFQEWRWYKDGVLQDWMSDNTGPTSINDVNNWLGRSMWSGDSNTDGVYNEFRVYDYALSPNQILGNKLAGPDVVNVPEPASIAMLGLGAAALAARRRRQKTV